MMKKLLLSVLVLGLVSGLNFQCARKGTQTASTSSGTSTGNTTAGTTGSSATTSATGAMGDYLGKYKMQSDDIPNVTVTLEDGRLYGQAEGQPKTELKPDGKDKFLVPEYNAVVLFNRNGQQQISGVTIQVNGAEITGDKVKD